MGVLIGPDGLFLADASYLPVTDKVFAAIRGFSSEPVRYVINTHAHPDHTGGNPNFVKQGAVLLAREAVRKQLAQALPTGGRASQDDPDRLPVVTYGLGEPVTVRMNAETVRIVPIPPAHTSGDSIIQFENADVVMIGDFYRNYGYPFVDTSLGGTVAGVLQALEMTLQLAGPSTHLVPGHGTTIGRADLTPYRDMILDIRSQVQDMIDAGKSLQEVLAANVTAAYDATIPGALDVSFGATSRDRFVSTLYAELGSGAASVLRTIAHPFSEPQL